MLHRPSRRQFLGLSAVAAAAPVVGVSRGDRPVARATAVDHRVTSDRKLRLLVVGVANRGQANLEGVMHEDIVALCDIDSRYLHAANQKLPGAKPYVDWRDALAHDGLDGVVVSTTDHTHAAISKAALERGLHVYCEKPLSHTVGEARMLTELAAERGLVTQLGTQIHSLPNYRRVVELVRSGAIGRIREVDVWCGVDAWGGVPMPSGKDPVPDFLAWDLWLGPAPARDYVDGAFHPANWRRFWDYGGGNLADMGCHFLDLAFWALDLRYPTSVVADGPALDGEATPKGLGVRWEFPASHDGGPVTLTWHDAGRQPARVAELGLGGWRSAVLFVGEKGHIVSDYYRHELGPKAKFEGFTPPAPSIADSPGHYVEWTDAIRGKGKPLCHFGYSGPLTETVLLGNVSYRLGNKKLVWDAATLRATNAPEAEGFLRRTWREGY
ncbi:MAG: Gfo/Idh/MocA family protein [Planctomycetota bacterium]